MFVKYKVELFTFAFRNTSVNERLYPGADLLISWVEVWKHAGIGGSGGMPSQEI